MWGKLNQPHYRAVLFGLAGMDKSRSHKLIGTTVILPFGIQGTVLGMWHLCILFYLGLTRLFHGMFLLILARRQTKTTVTSKLKHFWPPKTELDSECNH